MKLIQLCRLQKVLKTVTILDPSELNCFDRVEKDPLATLVDILFNLFENNLELCKSAASKVDQLKMEQLDSQQEIIKMKQDGLDLWM